VKVETIRGVERPTSVKMPSGAISTTEYDPDSGLPTKRIDASGVVTTYKYDQFGRVVETATSSGLVQRTSYAPHGDVEAVTVIGSNPNGSPRVATTRREYDAHLRPYKVIDALGGVTTTHFDHRGRVEAVVDPAGGVTQYTRDGAGNVTSVRDARGFTTTMDYDGLGRIMSSTNALGHTTTRTYNQRGLLATTSNFRGEETRQEYDLAGQPIKSTDAASNVTTIAYDLAGQLSSRGNGRGFVTTYRYDSAGRLIETRHPDLTTTSTIYDADGNVRGRIDELGRKTAYVSDGAGKIRFMVLPDEINHTESKYDADGRVVEQIDPLGRRITTEYDDLGRPFKTTVAAGTAEAVSYTTEFDLANRVSALVTGNGARWTYEYDAVGRKTSETDPLGNTRGWKYDRLGNVIETTEPDGTTPLVSTLEYDPLSRIKRIQRPDESIEISYSDPTDRSIPRSRTTVVTRGDQQTTVTRTYDALNRLILETVGPNKVAYAYDANSNVASVSVNDAIALTYQYDRRDRCTRIVDERQASKRQVDLSYDAAGQLSQIIYPSRLRKAIAHGKRGEIRTIWFLTEHGVPFKEIDFAYDAALRLRSRTERAGGTLGATTAYEYDALDRLTSVINPDGTRELFAYDKAGNITTYTNPLGTEVRRYDAADQLICISNSKSAWFDYNKRGQLVKVVEGRLPSNKVSSYRFDTSGRLVSVVENGAFTLDARYRDNHELDTFATREQQAMTQLWALGNIVMELSPSGVPQNGVLSLLGMDEPIERQDANGRYETLLTDHLMSAIAAYDDTGAVIRATDYSAYGALRAGADPGPIGFHGARQLGKTGLYYLRNRVYSPQLQRFLTRDPIGFGGGTNQYQYANLNPISFRDPLGLKVHYDPSIQTLVNIVKETDIGRQVWEAADTLDKDVYLTVEDSAFLALYRKRPGAGNTWDLSDGPIRPEGYINANRKHAEAIKRKVKENRDAGLGDQPVTADVEYGSVWGRTRLSDDGTRVTSRVFRGAIDVWKALPDTADYGDSRAHQAGGCAAYGYRDRMLRSKVTGALDRVIAAEIVHELAHAPRESAGSQGASEYGTDVEVWPEDAQKKFFESPMVLPYLGR
jgi:RHS repeat-associated protein